MLRVGDCWRLRACIHRWQVAVEVMAGQRTVELREVVLMRACIG